MDHFLLKLFILLSSLIAVSAFEVSSRPGVCSSKLFGRKEDLDEQWRIQQEMLALRKNPKMKAEYMEKVEARRVDTAKKSKQTLWAKNVRADIDPLEKWKAAKEKGLVKDLGYEAPPSKGSSLFGINIPLVASPIDVPAYDNGQRFDLRLPYAERGYEDKDSDVMAKISNVFSNLFGNKKEKEEKEG